MHCMEFTVCLHGYFCRNQVVPGMEDGLEVEMSWSRRQRLCVYRRQASL
jgi:hypothetical protein